MDQDSLIIAANTMWVVFAAGLVLFMQAGFALLEVGLTRMKNAAHVAGKNLLIFAVCALTYWVVGFGLAFGDRSGAAGSALGSFVGTSGFLPDTRSLLALGSAPFSFFERIPAAAAWFFQVTFAGVALAIVWGAMAERTKLWVYMAFGAAFTVTYSIVSHWVWHGDGWLFALGMQDFAGSTVVHYQGALAALAGAILLGPRLGRRQGKRLSTAIPGHNIPFAVIGCLILWLGWMGFNPGSTLGVETGGTGFFAYVALTTNLAAAAGCIGGLVTAWRLLGKPEVSMMLNGVIAALVAITAACGFVAPWAAALIGFVAGVIAIAMIPVIERMGIDDPIGAIAVHGVAGVWGTLATGIFASPQLAERLNTGSGGLVYTGSFHQLGVQALGLAAVGAFSFTCSFGVLWVLRKVWGIRVEADVEHAGLDLAEHGMWGYPEMHMPVSGGYRLEHEHHVRIRETFDAGRRAGGASAGVPEPLDSETEGAPGGGASTIAPAALSQPD